MFRAYSVHNESIEKITDFEELEAALKDPRHRVWLDLDNPKREEMEFLEKTLGFHPLLLEDILKQNQRPKVEPYDNCMYMVFKVVDLHNPKQPPQLDVVLGPNYLVTSHVKQLAFLEDVWQRTEKNPSILSRGADFTLYAILDVFVDSLFPIITEMDTQIDAAEDKAFKDPSPAVLVKILSLKKKCLAARRQISPLRDMLATVAKYDNPFINKKNLVYYRDIYDHVLRITESIDNSREMLTATMEGYVSSISNNLNVIMKKLAAVAAIIMVPAMIAGIYGMNFDDISSYALGNPMVAFMLMGASVFILGFYLKWRGWL
ncbi:magnesium/cobalt transporter CorA [Candidatus Micrarchaeota archaeon]|nr:magnesium/cobalt transporter CorA [Candidatus Micrarchaeota archaeon]